MVPVQTLLYGTAKEGAGSPACTGACSSISQHVQPHYFLFLFPQGRHKLRFVQLPEGKSSPFRAGRVKGIGRVGTQDGRHKKELSHAMLFLSHSSGCTSYS